MVNIYSFTAFIIFICSIITFSDSRSSKRTWRLLCLLTVWLILYEGLRWNIGTDWISYYSNFMSGYESEDSHIEPGFALLVNYIRSFTSSYTVFLLIITTFIYSVVYKTIKKYSILPIVSLCIYYCTMLGILGSNRQLLALMFCMISWNFIFKKQLFLFIIFVFLAASLHSTALTFLPAYFIVNHNFKSHTLIGTIILTLIVGLSGIVNHLPFIDYVVYLDSYSAEKLQYYSDGDATAYSVLGTLKRLLLAYFCIIMLTRKNETADEYLKAFAKLYLIGVALYLLFNGSVLSLISGRGALYYNICEILIIPYIIKTIAIRYKLSLSFWIIYFIFVLYIMFRDINSYYVLDGVDIYRPYKCILF